MHFGVQNAFGTWEAVGEIELEETGAFHGCYTKDEDDLDTGC